MPGNFPSQQAGAAAKNKPPVAIIIGAVAAVVVIALAAVFFLTNRVSRSDYEEALVQTQALESSYTAINEEFSRRRAQRTTIHPPLMTRARRS